MWDQKIITCVPVKGLVPVPCHSCHAELDSVVQLIAHFRQVNFIQVVIIEQPIIGWKASLSHFTYSISIYSFQNYFSVKLNMIPVRWCGEDFKLNFLSFYRYLLLIIVFNFINIIIIIVVTSLEQYYYKLAYSVIYGVVMHTVLAHIPCPISLYTVFIKYCFFSKNSRKFATSPSPALGCYWLYKKLPANRRVQLHCVESFEGLIQRCRRGRGCIELW